MAHVEKYHKGALGHLCKHYQRAKDENGDYIKFKNQSIDLSKTAGNYNLAVFQPLPQIEFIRKRLSEVKVFNRADVKVMCDWIVTLPKIMGNDEKRFFEEVFKFLSQRYGRENVISAYIHRDETTPHLHFAFVPVTTDKKKGIQKVSAKEVLTRTDLQKFHGDLDGYLTRVFGYSTGILNDATRDGNKSIDELKRGTAIKTLRETQAKQTAAEQRIEDLNCPPSIKPVKVKKDVAVITVADLENVNNGLAKIKLSDAHKQDADIRVEAVNHEKQMAYFSLWKQYDKQKAEYAALESEANNMRYRLNRFDRIFKTHPNLLDSLLQLEIQMERQEAEAKRAAQAAKRRLRQLEKGETELE